MCLHEVKSLKQTVADVNQSNPFTSIHANSRRNARHDKGSTDPMHDGGAKALKTSQEVRDVSDVDVKGHADGDLIGEVPRRESAA